jgi:hypothetical protein
MSQSSEKWDDDSIQFPRLLAEISAVGLSTEQWEGLCTSMDIDNELLNELFDRADNAWERAKGNR